MSKSFTIVQLRYFSVVAKLENMTSAALALNVTQSTLSSSIGHLEREMGVALFTRLPSRGLRLTPAGRRLLLGSQAFLEEADLLYQSVHDEGERLAGELVVGIFSPLAPFRAPTILRAFETAHPLVKLSFLEGDQEALRRSLLEGACEVALMYDLGVGQVFERQVVERVPPHVLVSADHPRAAFPHEDVSLLDFADEPLILLDLPHTREYYLDMFKRLGIEPRIRHLASGYETVRSFVSLGRGYSVLNQRLAHDRTYAGGKVVPLGIKDEVPPTEVSLVRPVGSKPTKKSLAFEAVCRDLYGTPAG